MIEERTKFYNGLDKKQYMDAVLREYLKLYADVTKPGPVNKRNVEILRLINEYNDKYIYFRRLTTVITEFLKEIFGTQSNYFSNMVRLKQSCKGQYEMFMVVKKIVKRVPLVHKYYVTLEYEIAGISNRLDYLIDNIIFNYLKMTPLNDYMKQLEDNGKSLKEDICENINLDENVADNPDVSAYIKRVLDSLNMSDEEYIRIRTNYENFLKRKYELAEKEKMENKKKQKEQRYLETESKLQKDASLLYTQLINGNLKSTHAMINLGKQFADLKMDLYEDGRIILIGKTIKGSSAKTYYVNQKGALTESLSQAKVFTKKEPLPKDIQEKIDSKDFASAEVMIIV